MYILKQGDIENYKQPGQSNIVYYKQPGQRATLFTLTHSSYLPTSSRWAQKIGVSPQMGIVISHPRGLGPNIYFFIFKAQQAVKA